MARSVFVCVCVWVARVWVREIRMPWVSRNDIAIPEKLLGSSMW